MGGSVNIRRSVVLRRGAVERRGVVVEASVHLFNEDTGLVRRTVHEQRVVVAAPFVKHVVVVVVFASDNDAVVIVAKLVDVVVELVEIVVVECMGVEEGGSLGQKLLEHQLVLPNHVFQLQLQAIIRIIIITSTRIFIFNFIIFFRSINVLHVGDDRGKNCKIKNNDKKVKQKL